MVNDKQIFRQRRSRQGLAVAAIAGLLLVCASFAALHSFGSDQASSGSCSVGTPARLDAPGLRAIKPQELDTEIVVLGCGKQANGQLTQVVGYASSRAFCISVDNIAARTSRVAFCKPSNRMWLVCGDESICTNGLATATDKPKSYGEVTGELSPDAEGVRVSYRSSDGLRHIAAIIARLEGPMLEELHQKEAGAFFAASMSSCATGSVLRIVASSRNGKKMATKALTAKPVQCERNASAAAGSFHVKYR